MIFENNSNWYMCKYLEKNYMQIHHFPSTRCFPSRKSFTLNEAKQVRGPLWHFAQRSGDQSPDLCHAVPRISTSFGSVCFAPSCSAKGSFRWFSHHRGCYAFDCLCACSGLRQYKCTPCWVRVAISTWNISRLRNTVKKQLQWLRKRVKKKNPKLSVIYCGQVWIGETPRKPKRYRKNGLSLGNMKLKPNE